MKKHERHALVLGQLFQGALDPLAALAGIDAAEERVGRGKFDLLLPALVVLVDEVGEEAASASCSAECG